MITTRRSTLMLARQEPVCHTVPTTTMSKNGQPRVDWHRPGPWSDCVGVEHARAYTTRCRMRRNRLGEIETCCWPGCTSDRYEEPSAPPFCGKHLIRCAAYVSSRAKDLMDAPLLPPRPPLAASLREPDDKAPLVYYVRLGDHIKIGTTTNLRARMSALYIDHNPEALLATEPGGREVERERHYDFREDRAFANRELFNPSQRLMAHIRSLNAAAA